MADLMGHRVREHHDVVEVVCSRAAPRVQMRPRDLFDAIVEDVCHSTSFLSRASRSTQGLCRHNQSVGHFTRKNDERESRIRCRRRRQRVRLARAGRGPARFVYDVSADGQRFLVNTLVETAAEPVTLVVNWPALLKK
jgi:hypothetical protein